MRVDLDDQTGLRNVDASDMLGVTARYAGQFREGLDLARRQFTGGEPGTVRNVVLLGTGGGSAAGGNLLRSYLFADLPVPLAVNQGYDVPAYVGPDTLALVVTHSGNTEETLAAYWLARARGARVVAITAGGRLLAEAERNGGPVIRIPDGLMPRAALGYIAVPILVVLARLGLIADRTGDIEETIDLLDELAARYGPEVPAARNPAKQLAAALDGRLPLVYGALEHTAAVAWRWKNQFGENSKVMAFWNAVPALHHDEIVGWDGPAELTRPFAVVFLRDQADSEKIRRRIDITMDLLRGRAGAVLDVASAGGSLLARLFSLVYLGDFVSLYLALLRGVDPTPVAIIDRFKARMGQSG